MDFGSPAYGYHDGSVSYQICADEVQDVLWVRLPNMVTDIFYVLM